MAEFYTLSIEDRVEGRTVYVKGSNGFQYEATYNPKADPGEFNSDGPFNTPFSIRHPFAEVANKVARNCLENGQTSTQPIYRSSVNEEQENLFKTILGQAFERIKAEKPKKWEIVLTPDGEKFVEENVEESYTTPNQAK